MENNIKSPVQDHRSFPDAADGRPMPPMAVELMTAGLNGDDARFVALQLAQNGLTLVPAPSAPAEVEGLVERGNTLTKGLAEWGDNEPRLSRGDWREINGFVRDATARLTAELAEAREKNGALIERAADIADTYRDSCTPGGMQAISDTIACSIRAIATEAETNALAEIVKKAVDAETRDMRKALEDLLKAHESGWPDKQDWGAGDRARATIARLDKRKEGL